MGKVSLHPKDQAQEMSGEGCPKKRKRGGKKLRTMESSDGGVKNNLKKNQDAS